MKAIKEHGLVQLIDDAFFQEEIDRGCQFFVRRTNLMREKRTLDIIDEIELRMKMQKEFEEYEAKRDMTYDEFLGKYLDHIEGKIANEERMNTRPITAEGDETINKVNNSGKEQEDSKEEEIEKKSERLNES